MGMFSPPCSNIRNESRWLEIWIAERDSPGYQAMNLTEKTLPEEKHSVFPVTN